MSIERTELECGCEILVYGDGSAKPEVVFCHLHNAAADLREALSYLKSRYTDKRICLECDHEEQSLPDCVNLFKVNKALFKAEGKIYEPA